MWIAKEQCDADRQQKQRNGERGETEPLRQAGRNQRQDDKRRGSTIDSHRNQECAVAGEDRAPEAGRQLPAYGVNAEVSAAVRPLTPPGSDAASLRCGPSMPVSVFSKRAVRIVAERSGRRNCRGGGFVRRASDVRLPTV